MRVRAPIALLLVIGVVWLAPAAARAETPPLERFEFSEIHMGTRARIVVYASDQNEAAGAARAGFAEIARLDAMLSDYRADSELSRLNARAGQGAVEVSAELMRLLRTCDDMVERTGGAFDPSLGPMVELWRRSREAGALPTEDELARARAVSGWALVELDDAADLVALKQSGMKLDLGGIGKGYAAMRARDAIVGAGHPVCLVGLSGDIAVADAPPGRRGWDIEITTIPEVSPATIANTCISTSGDIEQFVEINGVRYSHIIDPTTGLGARHRASASVVCVDGAVTDAVATAMCAVEEGSAMGLGLAHARTLTAYRSRSEDGSTESAASMQGFPSLAPWAYLEDDDWRSIGFPAGWQGFAGDPPVVLAMSPDQRAAAQSEADTAMRGQWAMGRDGVLHFHGAGASLRSAREYGDFVLALEWKIAAGGDSGIYLRGIPQVQIWDNPIGSGGLYNNQTGRSTPLAVADKPVGEWNEFIIRMIGERVTVWLNGVLVVDEVVLENYWDRGAALPERGWIELQAHGTPLWFRNIRILDLERHVADDGSP